MYKSSNSPAHTTKCLPQQLLTELLLSMMMLLMSPNHQMARCSDQWTDQHDLEHTHALKTLKWEQAQFVMFVCLKTLCSVNDRRRRHRRNTEKHTRSKTKSFKYSIRKKLNRMDNNTSNGSATECKLLYTERKFC